MHAFSDSEKVTGRDQNKDAEILGRSEHWNVPAHPLNKLPISEVDGGPSSDSFLSKQFRRAGLQKSLETAWQFSGLIAPVSMANREAKAPGQAANGGIPRPRSSLSQSTPEEAARAAAAAAAAVRPPPSIVVSAKQPSKLKRRIGGFWGKGKGPGSFRKGEFNPEELTSQKRQWARLQKQGLVGGSHLAC
jgi:hypothetical protein